MTFARRGPSARTASHRQCAPLAWCPLAATLALAGTATAQDWPAFRGPTGNGIARVKHAPLHWNTKRNVRWRTPLPRPANGSPIVSGKHVFVTGPEDEGGKRRSLYCFDRGSGKRLWARTATVDEVMPTHRTNPYGGSTPATDGQRVVVWHASAGLHCYDFTGKRLWHRDLGKFRHEWGYGTSPVIHGGLVYLNSGPGARTFVTAIDLGSGKTVWQTDEAVPAERRAGGDRRKARLHGSWCTPLLARIDGKTQVLCSMATRLVAYHPNTGAELWSCRGLTCRRGDLVYSSPCIADGVCMIVGGYDGPEIGVRLAGNRGDVTEKKRLWRHPRRPSNCGSGVVAGGHLYIPDMRGMVACVEPRTGKRLWTARGARGSIWSSIVLATGRLYVTNQKGATVVFRPNPEKLDVLAVNRLEETTNSTPAFAGRELFLRTHDALYCIAEPATPRTDAGEEAGKKDVRRSAPGKAKTGNQGATDE